LSDIYAAAAVLNVESLNFWRKRSFGMSYYKTGIESLTKVLKLFNPIELNDSNEDFEVFENENSVNNKERETRRKKK
jgi:hypothetical protein